MSIDTKRQGWSRLDAPPPSTPTSYPAALLTAAIWLSEPIAGVKLADAIVVIAGLLLTRDWGLGTRD